MHICITGMVRVCFSWLPCAKPIVYLLKSRKFEALRNFDLTPFWKKIGSIFSKICCWKMWGKICCCRCGSVQEDDEKDDEEKVANGDAPSTNQEDRNRKNKNKCKASNYFLSMNRREVWKWHLGGLLSVCRCRRCTKPFDYELIHHRYMWCFY